MKQQLLDLLQRYAEAEGCEPAAAFRDLLTDAMHVAESLNLDFAERLASAGEVFAEEHETPC